MLNSQANYDVESGQLLEYLSRIALRIRSLSWGNRDIDVMRGSATLPAFAVSEIELLSDATHNIGDLGRAMAAAQHEGVAQSAELFTKEYQLNAKVIHGERHWADPALRSAEFWLEGARIFTSIAEKARMLQGAASRDQ